MSENKAAAAAAGTIDIGDLRVSRMGFGAMRITGEGVWGPPPDVDEAQRLLRRVVALGVDFIDTADSYGPDVSEELITQALYPYPPGLVITTKAGSLRPGPGEWMRDCRPEHLRAACEGSLRKLRLEQIPLYQLHAVDPRVPIEESVGALLDLQQSGKIRHIGVSNVDEEQLRRAQAVAPIVSVQNRYNVLERSSDALLDICEREGMAFLPWAPLGQGRGGDEALARIAAAHAASVQQVMLGWLLARSPAVLPIPGTGSIAHAEEDMAAADLRMTGEELRRLDELGR